MPKKIKYPAHPYRPTNRKAVNDWTLQKMTSQIYNIYLSTSIPESLTKSGMTGFILARP